MFKKITNLISHYLLDSKKKYKYSISRDKQSIGFNSYKTITEAIEATKGLEYYIHEEKESGHICKGKWKDYMFQKEL